MLNNKDYYHPFLIPIGILPIALFICGLGETFYYCTDINLAIFFVKLKEVFFLNMPLMFAALLPFYLAKHRNGIAMVSGVVSFVILTAILDPDTLSNAFFKLPNQINTAFFYIDNLLIGSVCGLLTTYTYNRFYDIQLPSWLSFFSGRRSVPIITAIYTIFLSFILYYVWPMLFRIFIDFHNFMSQGNIFFNSIVAMNVQIISTFAYQDTISNLFNTSYSNTMFYNISMIPVCIFLLRYCWYSKSKCDYFFSTFIIIAFLLKFDQTSINILLLLFSPILWIIHCICIGLTSLLPNLSNSTWGTLFLPLYYLGFKYMKKKNWQSLPFFKDNVEIPAVDVLYRLVNAMGGFENIKELEVISNQLIMTVFDLEFVDTKTMKKLTGWTISVESQHKIHIILNVNPYVLINALKKLEAEEIESLLI